MSITLLHPFSLTDVRADRADRADEAALSDAELLRKHVSGDRVAFGILIHRHRCLLWRAIRQVGITCEEEGHDVLQEALLKVHRHAPRWEGTAKVTTWLFTITRNTALSYLRDRSRRIAPEPLDFAERMRTIATSCWREDSAVQRVDLQRFLNRVSAELRQVLVLTILHGMSEAEVADELNIPVGTVKSRKSRARQAMREVLREEWGIDVSIAA